MAVHKRISGRLTAGGGIDGHVPEAQNDGIAYVRRGEGWVAVAWDMLGGTPEAGSFAISSGTASLWFFDPAGAADLRTAALSHTASEITLRYYDDARATGVVVLRITKALGVNSAELAEWEVDHVAIHGSLTTEGLAVPTGAPTASPLPDGAIWFDVATSELKVWDGSAWKKVTLT